jgi:phosphonate transport system permease protein
MDKKIIKAFLIDCFLWSYSIVVLQMIFWNRMIQGLEESDFSWRIVGIEAIIGIIISALFFSLKDFSVGKNVVEVTPADYEKPWYFKIYVYFSLFFISITLITGLYISQVSMREFFSEQGIKGAQRIFLALANPTTLFAAIETIYMALIATVVAIPLAFVLSFFAARNLTRDHWFFQIIYAILRVGMNLTRSIEPLVWAIILSVWVGIGPFAGMLALMVNSVASLIKLYSEQIETIDQGPVEAMIATGAHPIQVIWYGVVPQIVMPFLSYTIYRWDTNVRMATIIGLVGGGGVGTLLMQYQMLAKWNEVGLIVIVIAFIVWAMDYASAKIREALK